MRRAQGTNPRRGERGMTLPELLISVAVVGILTGVSVVFYGPLNREVSAVIHNEDVERLNQALAQYRQVVGNFTVAADDGASTDEQAVMAMLKTRNALTMPGSPYLEPSVNFAPSVGTEDEEKRFRAVWNGYVFQVIPPDGVGSGVFLD
ncbi:hypothetical protein BH23VER1_BH23VER1_06390 [soil metagenome]